VTVRGDATPIRDMTVLGRAPYAQHNRLVTDNLELR
jgi:hypothetical protein